MKKLRMILALLLALSLAACAKSENPKSDAQPAQENASAQADVLVAYFSAKIGRAHV